MKNAINLILLQIFLGPLALGSEFGDFQVRKRPRGASSQGASSISLPSFSQMNLDAPSVLAGYSLQDRLDFVVNNIQTLQWQGYDIPVNLVKFHFFGDVKEEAGKNLIYLEVPTLDEGSSVVNDAGQCLRFYVKTSGDGKAHGYIEIIEVQDNICPGPEERRGSYFLSLIEAFSKHLGLLEIALMDTSCIPCPSSLVSAQANDESGDESEDAPEDESDDGLDDHEQDRDVKLTWLKTMTEGQGWYEKCGYRPKNDFSYQEYRAAVERLRGLNVEILVQAMSEGEDKNAMANLLDHFKEGRVASLVKEAKNEITMSAFILWLYNERCESFAGVEEIVSNELKADKDFVPYFSTTDWVKTLIL